MDREFVLATPHGPLRGQLAQPPAPRGLALLVQLLDPPGEDGEWAGHGLALLSMPLLTEQETHFPDHPYNVSLLAQRLIDILDRVRIDGDTESLPLGLFATGHAAPAALRVAARRDAQVLALACHGGLVDQAGLESLRLLEAPMLMLADGDDVPAQTAYRRAAEYLSPPHRLIRLQPGENPAGPAARWFGEHLPGI